ncbi:MAG: hypothetical protein IJ272_04535, partial [Clostridia bacterium]|nr:hypothetical protein [Clostridia bacterium]
SKKNNASKNTINSNTTSNKTYVLNTSTKKFHYDSCSSAKIIANKNKDTFKGSRQTLINQGYDACKRCNP